MEIIESPQIMQKRAAAVRRRGGHLGFVPTMGYLHEGHLSLIRYLGEAPQTRIMSIFVNPTQFGPGEDYTRYPRYPDRDRQLAESHGIDILFTPKADSMYPPGDATRVSVENPHHGGYAAKKQIPISNRVPFNLDNFPLS